jgi:Putative adhesin
MMKTVLATIVPIVLLVSPAAAQENAGSNVITVKPSDPNRIATLQVRLMLASVSITAYEGKEILITASGRSARTSRPNPQAEGLRRIGGTGGFSVTEENNVVSIRNSGFGDLSLEIQVPSMTNIQADVTISPLFRIDGVDGDIEVNVTNGQIRLTNIAGSIVAHSTNGGMVAAMRRTTPQKPMAFTSVNGNVDVALPRDTKAELKLRTTRGDIYTDFDVQLATAAANVGSNGSHRFESATLGTINGGGPNFELRTVNGNIFLRTAK